MADRLNRQELDQALFGRGNRQQLIDLLAQANPNLIAGAIVRALELQIVAEEMAREHGVNLDDAALAEYCESNREVITRQLDRAVNAFICTIVSQES